jgi:hypothetical protein
MGSVVVIKSQNLIISQPIFFFEGIRRTAEQGFCQSFHIAFQSHVGLGHVGVYFCLSCCAAVRMQSGRGTICLNRGPLIQY